MEGVPLITVERTVRLSSEAHPERGVLIIHPDLSVPSEGWREITETVTIARPDGRDFEAPAQISLCHVNISNPEASMDQRWRVTVLFQGLTSDDVPDGSKIFVSHETRNALLPNNAV
jgi:hypothetical protein